VPASSDLLEAHGLTKTFGGLRAVDDLSFTVRTGEILGLLGPNGSGKTTVFNLIAGALPPERGVVFFEGREITGLAPHRRATLGIVRTFQLVRALSGLTVLDNVMVGAHGRNRVGLVQSLLRTPKSHRVERQLRERAWGLLHFVGLADRGRDLAGTLAFADMRRLEIARALASDPELLLLDEPAAGMQVSEIHDLAELIRQVRDAGVTVLLIEHHMDLVMGLSDTVSVLDYGQKIAEGPPAEVRRDSRVVAAYLGEETE